MNRERHVQHCATRANRVVRHSKTVGQNLGAELSKDMQRRAKQEVLSSHYPLLLRKFKPTRPRDSGILPVGGHQKAAFCASLQG